MSKPTGFVILDQETGNVVRSGIVPEGDVESQRVKPGQSVLSTGDQFISSSSKLDMESGEWLASLVATPFLPELHAVYDFMVGKRTYSVDRQRFVEVALVGGILHCAEDGVWEYRFHTPEEASAVLAEFSTRYGEAKVTAGQAVKADPSPAAPG